MPLTSGSKLGPYEIAAPIGAGGMGEVYRAHDSALGRDVAVKVLPASFSEDGDRLRRFKQEAQAAAALNHPNILTIFHVGEYNGSPYIVSELLEGESLRQRLNAGSLPVRRAIDYSVQVARGLAAAHDKGIIHRDLKPENIFLTRDGRAKILDFGLAKLTRPGEVASSSDALTMTGASEPGFVLGTVGYMSPEQVRGLVAAPASDLFSFGAILYEMLTGKRAFRGETAADTMSAILKEDPPDLSETRRNVPPGLERIVNHCLEKNPAQRFQSASDVAFDLEALTASTATSKTDIKTLRTPPREFLRPALAFLLLVIACTGTYFLGAQRHGNLAARFHRLTYRRGAIGSARFSPDGQTIVYGAALEGKPVELFTTRFDSTDSRLLGLAKTELLSISSSGELAVLLNPQSLVFSKKGTLARVSLSGGTPREVLDEVQWADWTPDGSDLAVVRSGGSRQERQNHLEFPANKIIYQPQGWISHVRFSRQGDLLALADHLPTGDDGRVVVVDREGKLKAVSRFYTTVEGVAWSDDGKEVWFAASPSGAARAICVMNLRGQERLVLHVPGTLTLQDIARDGRVLLTEDNTQMEMVALPPGEANERNLSWFDWSGVEGLSPDGKTLVFDETGEGVGAKYGVFIRKTDGTPAVRLGDGIWPAMSPDGKWVAALDLSSPAQIELLPTGVGQPQRLTNDALVHIRVAWVPDGSGIVSIAAEPNQLARSYLMDLRGKSRAITPLGTTGTRVTPDSKYLLATDGERKRWLYPLTGGDAVAFPVKLEDDDMFVRFEPDGKSVLVMARGIPAKIERIFLHSSRREEEVRQISPSDPAGVQEIVSLSFSADAKSYAYSYFRTLSDLWVVDGLK